MPADRPIVHLFCNAHIDPVWMWGWEEGLREAISTFRTAADLLDEFPEFVFNHNESLLYEWVEQYDPLLFARIRQHVQAGRWNISGGWYLQPDCNLPGGESLVRTILEGRRYFAETFGARPVVAYNFDSFGHPSSLPQLLNGSGFEMYIHCRPVASQLELPAPFYRWRGADGSEVLAVRPDTGWYGTPNPGQAQEQARKGIEIARDTRLDTIVTWGLGDHGGGATRHDLLLFREMIAECADSDVELRHSTPEAFLRRIAPHRRKLPVFEDELQRTLAGTYTSVATIKRDMRQTEALLLAAERWSALAWWRHGRAYPATELREAWKRALFNTFHDVLCGSLLESAIDGVEDMFGYANDVARRALVRAQYALLPAFKPESDTIPIYVFNPHATAIKAPVGINFLSAYAPPPKQLAYTLYDDSGRVVPSQAQGGASVILDEGTWQPFCGFVADMPPLSARRYEVRYQRHIWRKSRIIVREDEAGIRVETPHWRARFDRAQAALVELVDVKSGCSLLKGPLRFVAMRDHAHAWGGENNVVFNDLVSPLAALTPAEVGAFAGMEGHDGPALRVIAQGPVWVTVECLTGWQHTRASVRHTFYADLPYIDLETQLYMQARRKMLKLQLPFDLRGARAICEVPYGVAERPADATEYPYARWVRLETPAVTVGVANSGQNGFDVSADGVLNLSVSRGGTHCSWSETDVPTEKSYTFMDQTRIDTRFRLLAGTKRARTAAALTLAAAELNQPLERFFAYHTATPLADAAGQAGSALTVTPATVMLTALKKAETEDALVVRLQETNGRATRARILLEAAPPLEAHFRPYEIKTFRIERGGGWIAVNLLEEAQGQ
jgi:alpha-mannosidase